MIFIESTTWKFRIYFHYRKIIVLVSPMKVNVELHFRSQDKFLEGPSVIANSLTFSAADGSNVSNVPLLSSEIFVSSSGVVTLLSNFNADEKYYNTYALNIIFWKSSFAKLGLWLFLCNRMIHQSIRQYFYNYGSSDNNSLYLTLLFSLITSNCCS